jgi:hypothetical protein
MLLLQSCQLLLPCSRTRCHLRCVTAAAAALYYPTSAPATLVLLLLPAAIIHSCLWYCWRWCRPSRQSLLLLLCCVFEGRRLLLLVVLQGCRLAVSAVTVCKRGEELTDVGLAPAVLLLPLLLAA